METQVNEQLNNEENNGLNPDQVLASLAFTNNLQKQGLEQQMLMSQVPQESPQEPQEAPEEELALETEETPPIDPEALKNEIMEEVKSTIKEEIEGLKDMLKDALNDDEENIKNENDEHKKSKT